VNEYALTCRERVREERSGEREERERGRGAGERERPA
jgi:hypothetical protein